MVSKTILVGSSPTASVKTTTANIIPIGYGFESYFKSSKESDWLYESCLALGRYPSGDGAVLIKLLPLVRFQLL